MSDSIIETKYKMLFDAVADVLREECSSNQTLGLGAAVLCASGNIFTGINIETSGYGVCAEPVALGAALSAGEKKSGGCCRCQSRKWFYRLISVRQLSANLTG